MMRFSLLLDQNEPNMDNPMFTGSEIPSKLGLLLVDDEEFNLKAIKRTLRGQGFNIFTALDGKSALQVMETEDIAIIVSDMRMPNMSGDELLIKIGARWPDTLKIILTGYTDISNTLHVLNSSSIFRYLSKPWDDELLLSTVHEASAIYWGRVMDYYFEKSTKKQNKQLQDSNIHLRKSVEQSHYQLNKINEKLKSAYEGEKRLRKERLDAERESIAKSQFLATMSHEIRTPLNSIIATSSLLLESQLTDEQKELVKLSLNGGTTLLSLINDILDFGKINSKKLKLHEEWFNLINLVEETCELLSGQIINKPVEIISTIEPNTPTEIFGDKIRIRQIITNLISNSLKFTENGCVEIKTSFEETLKISVKDSGIGMSKEDLKHIFEEFTQIDNSDTRAKGGTGLGLSICKQLCHLMNGEIKVLSEINTGSTFSIHLPLSCRNPIGYPIFDKPERNIALISTNTHLYQSLKTQISYFNCNIKIMDHPPKIYEAFFDAILYDLDSICISTEHHKNTSIEKSISVALISNDGVGRSEHIKNLGFDFVLRKPFRTSSIARHIIYNITPRPNESTLNKNQKKIILQFNSGKHYNSNTKKTYSLNKSILLAEDSPSNQVIIKSILKNMHVKVDIANNGKEAIHLAGENHYDIILMDMAMPIIDGISATRSIIENKSLNKTTPIIALTANADESDKTSCINAGMVDFLQKPIDVDLFRSTISKWSEKPKDIDPETAIQNTPIQDKGNIEGVKLIDLNVIKQLEHDTSAEVLPSIIDIFIEETQTRLPLMLKLYKNEDWKGLSREAHTLKSSSGSFGAIHLSVLSREIEDSIKSDALKTFDNFNSRLTTITEDTISALKTIKEDGL